MRMLYLLRHANSPAGGDDHARPIDDAGRARAEAIGARLAQRKAKPDTVLCSTARRARETLDALRAYIPLPDARFERELYLAGSGAMRLRVAALDDCCEGALLIGHNPGLAELVAILGREADREVLSRSRQGFPPAALAILALDIAIWADAAHQSGRLLEILD